MGPVVPSRCPVRFVKEEVTYMDDIVEAILAMIVSFGLWIGLTLVWVRVENWLKGDRDV